MHSLPPSAAAGSFRTRAVRLCCWLSLLLAAYCLPATPAHAATNGAEISVTPAKAKAAGIELATVAERSLRETITAPARLRYDDRKHVEIKIAAAGIVSSISVKPGDAVRQGAELAIVVSPEVAQSRAEVLSKGAELELASVKSERAQHVRQGLESLLKLIRHQAPPDEVASQIADAELGSYRQSILSKYSAFKTAAALASGVADPSIASVLPGREVQRRRADLTTASADLETALESSAYEADLEARAAHNSEADAMRQLSIRRQYLKALEGSAAAAEPPSESSLAELRICSPLAGVVQSRTFSVSERVAPGDSLFVVADTSTLWVEADIRENQASVLSLKPGDQVRVTVGTLGNRSLPATVHYIGGQVSAESNAASLVATIDNQQGLLRPGQFVQLTAPTAVERKGLAVPAAAIVDHEGARFVFVAVGPERFRRADVQVGTEQGEWAEIKSGVKAGDKVVSAGAFALKSELLLDQFAE